MRGGNALFAKLTRWMYAAASEFVVHSVGPQLRPAQDILPGPLVIVGFFSEPSGVGRAADLTLQRTQQLGFSPVAVHARKLLGGDHSDLAGCPAGGVMIVHCNPDEGVRVLARTPAPLWKDRKRIGYWAWELPRAPDRWRRAAALFHEVWAPSRFVADAIVACGVRGSVRVMPHPVATNVDNRRDRARWGLADGKAAVLAMADYRSSATRKNITGSIDICRRAASAAQPILLVIKALEAPPAALDNLLRAPNDHFEIRLMTETLGQDDVRSLIASVDVLLSPHRSEGFGLTLAEALIAGTPPLATGWSGNMQFMNGLSELLIDYRLVPVRDPTGIYGQRDQEWAEPSVADGAAKLLRLISDPGSRADQIARGARAVVAQADVWNPDMFGASVRVAREDGPPA